jgi:hypothetical protein
MDRKALTREYKEGRRPMGVYRILNRVNGKALVGASLDLPAMLNRHRFQLNAGAHANRTLQADWLTHGPDNFDFEVLDVLEPVDRPDYEPTDDLYALEQLWVEKLSPVDDRGYNSKPKKAS